ncbi:MAG: metal-dependent hydrolase [Candidatus Hodarchaeota archaeon]
MPSPVGHSLAGFIIYKATARPSDIPRWKPIFLYLFVANAADLDFLPGFLVGDPNRYHHGISHSIGFTLLLALAFSLGLFLTKRATIWRNSSIFFSLYTSHIFLDYLGKDTTPPFGVPLFWPLSDAYNIAPFAFLPDIFRVSSSGVDFIGSLFCLHNLRAASIEFLVMVPFLFLVFTWNRRPTVSTE